VYPCMTGPFAPLGATGDWNGDSRVDATDLTAFMTCWLSTPTDATCLTKFDFDDSGLIDLEDYGVMLSLVYPTTATCLTPVEGALQQFFQQGQYACLLKTGLVLAITDGRGGLTEHGRWLQRRPTSSVDFLIAGHLWKVIPVYAFVAPVVNASVGAFVRSPLAPPSGGSPSVVAALDEYGESGMNWGKTRCSFATGEMQVEVKSDGCVKPCIAMHEAMHVKQRGECCKKAAAALRECKDKPEGEVVDCVIKITNQYNKWQYATKRRMECEAHRLDIACLRGLEASYCICQLRCCTMIREEIYLSTIAMREFYKCDTPFTEEESQPCPFP